MKGSTAMQTGPASPVYFERSPEFYRRIRAAMPHPATPPSAQSRFDELYAQHRGSRPPRERIVPGGVTFYSIYRGMHGSFWLAREGDHYAIVTDHWRKYGTHESQTFTVSVDGDGRALPTRFRNEDRALRAAASALLRRARS